MTPSEIARGLSKAQISVLEYHARDDRKASCGDVGADLDLMFWGLITFAADGRLELTRTGKAVRAILEQESRGE